MSPRRLSGTEVYGRGAIIRQSVRTNDRNAHFSPSKSPYFPFSRKYADISELFSAESLRNDEL